KCLICYLVGIAEKEYKKRECKVRFLNVSLNTPTNFHSHGFGTSQYYTHITTKKIVGKLVGLEESLWKE
ncbi:hypothetical protein AADX89_12155, partial [Staphylococcus epidermidis]|uniref:hypothetical protein n=1 Tax=Staphylococcus epidermidis TaxID=1282 RepID=UPI0031201DB6